MAIIYPKFTGTPQLLHLKPDAESGNIHLVQCSTVPSLRVVPLVANATLALGMTLYFDIYGIVNEELAFGVGYTAQIFNQELVNFGSAYASNIVGYDSYGIDYTVTWQPYLDRSRVTMVLSTTANIASLDEANLGVIIINTSSTEAKGFTNVAY